MITYPISQYSSASTLSVHPKKVIVMGDSLVYGFGDREGGGWAERLRRQWIDPETPGPILYNLGVRGDKVQQVADRLENEFRPRGELRRRLPDVLVLSVGLNDAARLGRADGRLMTDEADFQQQINLLLGQAKRLCPVFFIGMVPVNEMAMPYAGTLFFSQADQRRFKEITQRACLEQNVPYLDIFERWSAEDQRWCHDRLCRDGIHPNVQGHQTLLQNIQGWQPLMDLLMN